MKRATLVFLLSAAIVATFVTKAHTEDVRPKKGNGVLFVYQDGTRWLSWGKDARLMYVLGFLEGRKHGLYDLQLDYADCDLAAAEKQGLYSGIAIDQLADSVDKFYSDPVNRLVTVPDALAYALEQIRGVPSSALQKSLEEIRRIV